MAVSSEEVRRIAKLAHLKLSEEEAMLYQGQFSRILELMEDLKSIGAPQEAVPPATSVLRPDEPRPFPEPQRILSLAPGREGDFYKVKKVIE